jgi:ABC-type branched-subunit amino acid transport system substrate-binding protein
MCVVDRPQSCADRLRRAPWLVAVVVAGLALASGCGSTVQYASTGQQLDGLSGTQSTTETAPTGGTAPTTTGLPGRPTDHGGGNPTAAEGGSNPTTNPVDARHETAVSGPVSRSPIKVGFLTIDYSKAYAAVGLSQGPAFDWKANYRALVDGLNKRGGLQGRRIEPYFYAIDGTAASYASESQAACAYLVQDEHVKVVVSYAASAQSFMLSPCFAQAGVAQIDANFGVREDTGDLHKTPGLIAPESLTVDRYASALITWANRQGWLTRANRLGVFVEDCPADRRTYDTVVVPLAGRLGIPVESYTTSCIQGFAEVSQTVSDVQSAALRFRADGVDRVMYLTLGESGVNGLFTQNADSQRWNPVYLLTTIAQPVNGAQIGQIATSQLPNTRGIGWMPGWDVDAPSWSPAQTALQNQCRATAHQGGVSFPAPRGPQANLNPYMECDTLLLLDRVLGITHGVTSFSAITGAVNRLASGYVSPMTDGPTAFAPGQHAGVRDAALFSYKASCHCFSYDTPSRPVP